MNTKNLGNPCISSILNLTDGLTARQKLYFQEIGPWTKNWPTGGLAGANSLSKDQFLFQGPGALGFYMNLHKYSQKDHRAYKWGSVDLWKKKRARRTFGSFLHVFQTSMRVSAALRFRNPEHDCLATCCQAHSRHLHNSLRLTIRHLLSGKIMSVLS